MDTITRRCPKNHRKQLYGLDIDGVLQLANFAVMMKARQYDRRFFNRVVQPHVYSISESNHLDKACVEYFANGDAQLQREIRVLLDELHDAKEYGTILKISQVDFDAIYARFDEINEDINTMREITLRELLPFVQAAQVMAQKYHVVVAIRHTWGSAMATGSWNIRDHYRTAKPISFLCSLNAVKDDGKLMLLCDDYPTVIHFTCIV